MHGHAGELIKANECRDEIQPRETLSELEARIRGRLSHVRVWNDGILVASDGGHLTNLLHKEASYVLSETQTKSITWKESKVTEQPTNGGSAAGTSTGEGSGLLAVLAAAGTSVHPAVRPSTHGAMESEIQRILNAKVLSESLGLVYPINQATVKAAFRRTSMLVHPDKVPDHLRDGATTAFRLMSEAYRSLNKVFSVSPGIIDYILNENSSKKLLSPDHPLIDLDILQLIDGKRDDWTSILTKFREAGTSVERDEAVRAMDRVTDAHDRLDRLVRLRNAKESIRGILQVQVRNLLTKEVKNVERISEDLNHRMERGIALRIETIISFAQSKDLSGLSNYLGCGSGSGGAAGEKRKTEAAGSGGAAGEKRKTEAAGSGGAAGEKRKTEAAGSGGKRRKKAAEVPDAYQLKRFKRLWSDYPRLKSRVERGSDNDVIALAEKAQVKAPTQEGGNWIVSGKTAKAAEVIDALIKASEV